MSVNIVRNQKLGTSLLVIVTLILSSVRGEAKSDAKPNDVDANTSRLNLCHGFSGFDFSRVDLVKNATWNTKGAISPEFQTFNLSTRVGIQTFQEEVKRLIKLGEKQKADKKKDSSIKFEFDLDKSIVLGLEQIDSLISRLMALPIPSPTDSAGTNVYNYQMGSLGALILELVYAVNSNYLSPIPRREDIGRLFARLDQNIGRGSLLAPAKNLKGCDLSQATGDIDPHDSTFWQAPKSIKQKNLYFGFGRSDFSLNQDSICTYEKPKTGYGIHPGMTIECQGFDGKKHDYKAKWGNETNSGPFVSRIFDALGYNTNIYEYTPGLKIAYDRKMLKQFNSRKNLSTWITILGILQVFEVNISGDKDDPFAFISHAALRDGTRVEVADLRRQLLKSTAPQAETEDSNYNVAYEEELKKSGAYFVMKAGSLTVKRKEQEDVGAWGFSNMGYDADNEVLKGSGLGHFERRELRGSGLLAAWLNSFDMRWENNRLSLFEDSKGNLVMKHLYSDLGAGLGKARSFLETSDGVLREFPWRFTVSVRDGTCNDSRLNPNEALQDVCNSRTFAIANYQTDDYNKTYDQMNLYDAQWMARYIAQISREQIEHALYASGLSAAQIYLYTAKLVNRRNVMLQNLGMQIPPISLVGDRTTFKAEDVMWTTRNFEFENDQRPLELKIIIKGKVQTVTVPTLGCRLEKGLLRGCKDNAVNDPI